MVIETHDHLGNPQIIEATRVLVRDSYGNPVAAVLELSGPPQHVFVSRDLRDPDFQEWLRNFGISSTVVVKELARVERPISIGD